MKAQKPAQGISKWRKVGNSETFKVECDCSSDDHSVTTTVEADEDFGVTVSHWVKGYSPLNGKSRWSAIFQLLFKGYYFDYHEIVMDKQTAKNWISAVDSAIKALEKDD